MNERFTEHDLMNATYSGTKLALEATHHVNQIHLEHQIERLLRSMDRDQLELRLGVYLCFVALCVIAWRIW